MGCSRSQVQPSARAFLRSSVKMDCSFSLDIVCVPPSCLECVSRCRTGGLFGALPRLVEVRGVARGRATLTGDGSGTI